MAILTVPATVAQAVADRLAETSVHGILNFTPARLNVSENIRIHHIDLAVELQTLVYFLKTIHNKTQRKRPLRFIIVSSL